MAVLKNKETFRCYVDKVWKDENLDIADEIFATKYLSYQSNGTVTVALVLLLGAISLDRLGFGMVLVLAFSAGLALVLTVVGHLMIYARKLFERYSFEAKVSRLLPVANASVITLAGLGIALAALEQTGIL
jgi:hypothetical protein